MDSDLNSDEVLAHEKESSRGERSAMVNIIA